MKRPVQQDDPPPFLGSWNAVYLLIVAALVLVGVLFYIFTKHFE